MVGPKFKTFYNVQHCQLSRISRDGPYFRLHFVYNTVWAYFCLHIFENPVLTTKEHLLLSLCRSSVFIIQYYFLAYTTNVTNTVFAGV